MPKTADSEAVLQAIKLQSESSGKVKSPCPKVMACDIIVSEFEPQFTFGLMPLKKRRAPLSPQAIGLVSKVFASGQRDRNLISSRVIPKIQKMVIDTPLLNTRHYKVRINGKVEQSRKRSSVLPNTSVS